MIDHQRKLLFVHIARTGGTSIETALVGEDWWEIDPLTKHVSASMARVIHGEDIWAKYTTFSVVRNPWDRVVSMWTVGWWYEEGTHFNGIRPVCFRDFVLGLKPHPHELYGTLHQHEILDEELDLILRFETLQADFSAMLKRIGCDDIVLPFKEKSDRRPYESYYDDETACAVAEIYKTDISRYGYNF